MSAAEVLDELAAAGVELELSDDGKLTAPAGTLTNEQRAAIKAHRAEIIERVRQAQRLTAALISAAMRACDFWGDSEEARQAMRQDVLSYPPAMRPELLAYFNSRYSPAPDISAQEQDKRP